MWWIPLVVGAGQTIYGISQQAKARQEYERAKAEQERNRPTIPKDVERLVSRAERGVVEGMPARSRYEDVISGRTATNVAAMREGAMTSTEYLSGVSDVYRGELEQLNKLATQEAVYRTQQEDRLSRALETRAQYDWQTQQFQYGESQQELGAAQQAYSAGTQNIWGGIQTGVGAFMQKYQSEQRMAELDKIYGTKKDVANDYDIGDETPWGTFIGESSGYRTKFDTPVEYGDKKVKASYYVDEYPYGENFWNARFNEWGVNY